MDSDKILVMSQGEKAEFASPSELLQNPESHFAKLVNSSKQNQGMRKSSSSDKIAASA